MSQIEHRRRLRERSGENPDEIDYSFEPHYEPEPEAPTPVSEIPPANSPGPVTRNMPLSPTGLQLHSEAPVIQVAPGGNSTSTSPGPSKPTTPLSQDEGDGFTLGREIFHGE